MALTAAEQKRRQRAHAKGEHSLCDAESCYPRLREMQQAAVQQKEARLHDQYDKRMYDDNSLYSEVDDATWLSDMKSTLDQASLLLNIAQSTGSVEARGKFLDHLEQYGMIGAYFESHRRLWVKAHG